MSKIPSPRSTPAREEIYICLHPRKASNHTIQISPAPFPSPPGHPAKFGPLAPAVITAKGSSSWSSWSRRFPLFPLQTCKGRLTVHLHSHERIPIFGTASPLGNNQILATFPSRPCQDFVAEPSLSTTAVPFSGIRRGVLLPERLRREMDRPRQWRRLHLCTLSIYQPRL